MLPDVPPSVEGRIPTDAEMEAKRRNGRYYLEDVWIIVREFPSADRYACPTQLEGLVDALRADVSLAGYEFVDASDRFNDLTHALHLTVAWASLVREARTTDKMFLVRRTTENSGALLMLQRQEHLRGQCTEMAPVAYIALVRGEQLVVTRDRVPDQATTERMLLTLAKHRHDPANEEVEETGRCTVPTMPAPLFNQQMRAVRDLMEALGVEAETRVEEANDAKEVEDTVKEVVNDVVEAVVVVSDAAEEK